MKNFNVNELTQYEMLNLLEETVDEILLHEGEFHDKGYDIMSNIKKLIEKYIEINDNREI